ncbi:MAG: efflux RND transporter permease subunit [Cyclobacteriaceae bacterium]|nr:efflux RND transporter permease subunit [Cyclobacteriaceae bacterium]
MIGISLIPRINLQLKPTRSAQNITVSYLWPRASARVIEQEVTSVLEGVFSRIAGVEEISSRTSIGEGEIQIALKKNARLDAIRFEIASSIRQVFSQLPDQVSYPLISVGTSGTR